MDGKILVLASNCNKELYGDKNTPSHFWVNFSEELRFPENERYGIGLREITYSSSIPTLTNENLLISFKVPHPSEEFEFTGQDIHEHPKLGGYINPVDMFYKTTYISDLPSDASVIVKIHELWAYPITGYEYTITVDNLQKFVRVTTHIIRNFIHRRVQIEIGLMWVLKVEYEVTVNRIITLDSSYFRSGKELIRHLNTKTTPLGVKFDISRSRVKLLALPPDVTVELRNNMEYVLGFNQKILTHENLAAEYDIRLDRGIFAFFVYINIVETSLVGEVYVPLLRSVSIVKRKYGQMVHQVIDNPVYIPLNRKNINSLEVQICDDSGELIPFKSGKTHMLLEFKKL